MPSVREMKEQLALEVEETQDVAEMAIAAINSVLNTAQLAIGVIAVVAALLAIFGINLILDKAQRVARRSADNRLDGYLKSDEFQRYIEQKVEEEVRKSVEKRWQQLEYPVEGSLQAAASDSDFRPGQHGSDGDRPFPEPTGREGRE